MAGQYSSRREESSGEDMTAISAFRNIELIRIWNKYLQYLPVFGYQFSTQEFLLSTCLVIDGIYFVATQISEVILVIRLKV